MLKELQEAILTGEQAHLDELIKIDQEEHEVARRTLRPVLVEGPISLALPLGGERAPGTWSAEHWPIC